jgi:PST family polysaccharide transporter
MVFLGIATGKHLIASDNQIIHLYKSIIGAVSNVVLNIILVPMMGIYGAALATVISYSFIAIWGNFFFKGSREIFYMTLKSMNPVASAKRMWQYSRSVLAKSI